MSGDITALLGPGTRFEGKLHFEGCVRIDGVFQGEIRSDDTLIVGEGAEIDGSITVATVVVRGTVRGDVIARRSIEVFAPGVIVGDLLSPEIAIERGARFEGRCVMGEVPTAAPEEALANEPRRPPAPRTPPRRS